MVLLWGDASLKTFLIVMNVYASVQFIVLLTIYLKVAGPALVP